MDAISTGTRRKWYLARDEHTPQFFLWVNNLGIVKIS
jgi:hypothetical protein